MTTDTILNVLRRAVEESTKDRSQIAKEAGISRKTLYDLLEGNKDPRWSTLEALTQVLGLRFGLSPAVLGEMAPAIAHRAPTSLVTQLIAKNATRLGPTGSGQSRAAELLQQTTTQGAQGDNSAHRGWRSVSVESRPPGSPDDRNSQASPAARLIARAAGGHHDRKDEGGKNGLPSA